MRECSFSLLRGKRVLIEGDVGSGKTRLLKKILLEAVSSQEGPVSLIDMAPDRLSLEGREVGGRVSIQEKAGLRVYRPTNVFAPRIQGRSREEVLRLAEENSNRIDEVLERYLKDPTPILFINDLTLYLHAGDLGKLERTIATAETFVGNAYKGKILLEDRGSGISARENLLLEVLETSMDKVIML